MVGAGYPPAEVWSYTPRRLIACKNLADKRRKRRLAEFVMVVNLATHGKQQEIKRVLRQWQG